MTDALELQHLDGRRDVLHKPTGATAWFDLDGSQLDGLPVWEVWDDDTYRVTREHFDGGTVVDVGAHVGSFSILAARAGAKQVVAFEPSPAYDRLVANIAHNRAERRIDARRQAVCGGMGALSFVDGVGGSSHAAAPYDDGHDVEAVALCDVVVKLERVDFLKIDCEGCEYDALDSLGDDIDRVGRIAMEWHVRSDGMPWVDEDAAQRFGDLVLWLLEHGWVRVYGRPSRGGLLWYERY